MGQNNSNRISHLIEALPNTFRDDQLEQILNDLNEEDSGKGYSEVIRTGAFVTSIIAWSDVSKTKKRTEATFTRTGPFVSSITKVTYSEDGTSIVSTISGTVTRTGNNEVAYVDVALTRP